MRAFEFLGGVPEIVTPDNLKSGVTKACRYEPGVNRTYEEMAAHYGDFWNKCTPLRNPLPSLHLWRVLINAGVRPRVAGDRLRRLRGYPWNRTGSGPNVGGR